MKTKPKITEESDPIASVHGKLKSCDPEIQHYVLALENENLKLTKQVAKLQAENMTANNGIKALIKQNEKDKRHALTDAMAKIGETLKGNKHKESQMS